MSAVQQPNYELLHIRASAYDNHLHPSRASATPNLQKHAVEPYDNHLHPPHAYMICTCILHVHLHPSSIVAAREALYDTESIGYLNT